MSTKTKPDIANKDPTESARTPEPVVVRSPEQNELYQLTLQSFEDLLKQANNDKLSVNEIEISLFESDGLDADSAESVEDAATDGRGEDDATTVGRRALDSDADSKKKSSSNPAWGVFNFDRLIRVLKGNYTLQGPVQQLIVNPDKSNSEQRLIITGMEAINVYCQLKQLDQTFLARSDVQIQNKRRVISKGMEIEDEYQVRLRLAEESDLDRLSDVTWLDPDKSKSFRYRKRYSFFDEKTPGVRFDLSVYKKGTGTRFSNATIPGKHKPKAMLFGPERYDIELEFNVENKALSAEVTDRLPGPEVTDRLPGPGKTGPGKTDEKLAKVTKDNIEIILDKMFNYYWLALQLKNDAPIIIRKSLRDQVYKRYTDLVENYNNKNPPFIGVDVMPLKLSDVSGETPRTKLEEYAVTFKTDGTRHLLFLDDVVNKFFLIDMNGKVTYTGIDASKAKTKLKTSLFDVEVVDTRSPTKPINTTQRTIWFFDTLIYHKIPFIGNSDIILGKRNKTITILLDPDNINTHSNQGYFLLQQKFHYALTVEPIDGLKTLGEFLEKANSWEGSHEYEKDGLILTKHDVAYPFLIDKSLLNSLVKKGRARTAALNKWRADWNIFAFKIKNLNQLTIDFMYRPLGKTTTEKTFSMLVRDGRKLTPFMPTYQVLDSYNEAPVVVKQESDHTSELGMQVMRSNEPPGAGFLIIDNFVYESLYQENKWVPIRVRPIKTVQWRPNAFETADSNWTIICNLEVSKNKTREENNVTYQVVGELSEDNMVELLKEWNKSVVPVKAGEAGDAGAGDVGAGAAETGDAGAGDAGASAAGTGDKKKKPSKTGRKPPKTQTPPTQSLVLSKWAAEYLKLRRPDVYYTTLYDVPAQLTPQETYVKPMRDMHRYVIGLLFNAVKKKLKSAVGAHRLLELASGRGGDMHRWQQNKFNVVGIELNRDQIAIAESRMRGVQLPIKIDYLHGDMLKKFNEGEGLADKDRAKGLLAEKFDVVSIQFAIAYAMESEESFTQLLRNVKQNLKPGGYFIGTTFIAHREPSEADPGVYDALNGKEYIEELYPKTNDVLWRIDKKYEDEELRDFGQMITDYLIAPYYQGQQVTGTGNLGIDEYLVNLLSSRLQEIAGNFGLRMVQVNGIGSDGGPQSFGSIYTGLKHNLITLPDYMKRKNVMDTLSNLEKTPEMMKYSRFNSVFIFENES